MYVRREAVLSSQIEGTQSTLEDVLEYELDSGGRELPADVGEVVNYARAMNQGLDRLNDLPLSLRLLREMHATLLEGVRGQERNPGEFRTSQNWIGPAEAPLARATFVPPPPAEMWQVLDQFELFLHQEQDLPDLVHRGVIRRPLLYLSYRAHRTEYYDRLQAIREEGNWEGWLRFFLKGVAETAEEATETARRIVRLREDHRRLAQGRTRGVNALRLLDLLFEQPLVNARRVSERLDVAFATANSLLRQLERLGLLDEITGARRNRLFRYTPYLRFFAEQPAEARRDAPVQTTETA